MDLYNSPPWPLILFGILPLCTCPLQYRFSIIGVIYDTDDNSAGIWHSGRAQSRSRWGGEQCRRLDCTQHDHGSACCSWSCMTLAVKIYKQVPNTEGPLNSNHHHGEFFPH